MSKDYLNILSKDPGHILFVEYADNLRKKMQHNEALRICLAGLSANQNCYQGRLLLARIFFDQGFYPFALRELSVLLEEFPDNKAILRISEKLDPGFLLESTKKNLNKASDSKENIIAEADFDLDELEGVDEK